MPDQYGDMVVNFDFVFPDSLPSNVKGSLMSTLPS